MGEPLHSVVAWVNPHNGCGFGANGTLIVFHTRDIGAAYLAQSGTRDFKNFRQAEAATNFYQLTTRDNDFPTTAQSAQGNDCGCGTIVDSGSGRGAKQLGYKRGNAGLPGAAQTSFEVEFKIAGACRGEQGIDRRLGQRCAAKVGVQHHAGGVDNAAQMGLNLFLNCVSQSPDQL